MAEQCGTERLRRRVEHANLVIIGISNVQPPVFNQYLLGKFEAGVSGLIDKGGRSSQAAIRPAHGCCLSSVPHPPAEQPRDVVRQPSKSPAAAQVPIRNFY